MAKLRILKSKKSRIIIFAFILTGIAFMVTGALVVASYRDAKNQTSAPASRSTTQTIKNEASHESGKIDANLPSEESTQSSPDSKAKNDEPASKPSASSSASPAKPSGSSGASFSAPPSASYQPVAPNPYCPTPTFSLSVAQQAQSTNLIITATASPDDPNLRPECGGGYNYYWPTVTYPSNGSLCSGIVYSIGSNNSWGVACSIYGNVPYGTYTYSFTVTASNGYAKTASRTASYTFHYVQQ